MSITFIMRLTKHEGIFNYTSKYSELANHTLRMKSYLIILITLAITWQSAQSCLVYIM